MMKVWYSDDIFQKEDLDKYNHSMFLDGTTPLNGIHPIDDIYSQAD